MVFTAMQVVGTNLLGTMICSRQAVRLFAKQPGGGHLFNVDGAGEQVVAGRHLCFMAAISRCCVDRLLLMMHLPYPDTHVCPRH
jgi:hypothetical protein